MPQLILVILIYEFTKEGEEEINWSETGSVQDLSHAPKWSLSEYHVDTLILSQSHLPMSRSYSHLINIHEPLI